jgi:ATP-dependent DNA helicase RecG
MKGFMQQETQHIEYKSSFNEDVIETLVAFANSQGGKVYLGLNDNGKAVKNFTIGKESIQNWINEIKNKTQPLVIPDVKTVKMDGIEVVELRVPEYPVKPVACRGKYFKRVGNSNHQMSLSEISDMYLKTFNLSWDYYIDTQHSIDNISLDKINCFIDKRLQGDKREDPLHLLQKYELLREGKITNACYLLFVKEFSPLTGIQAGRFKSPTKIIDSITISTDLFTEVDELMAFLRRHFMTEYIITGKIQREERFDYPEEAIREIVLNMIVHRDYRDSGDSIVKIFDDRIEFFNPGTLFGGLTIEQLLSDNYAPKARNTQINTIFKETGVVEKYGSGIQRIIDECKKHGGVRVDFFLQQHGFKVVVAKKSKKAVQETIDKTAQKTAQKTTQKTTQKTAQKTTQKIIEAIQQNAKITRAELSIITGISEDGIKWNLNQLKSRGIIERIGADNGGYWKVN